MTCRFLLKKERVCSKKYKVKCGDINNEPAIIKKPDPERSGALCRIYHEPKQQIAQRCLGVKLK